MVPRSILALALFASPSAAQEPDRLLIAICSKSFEELKQTIAGAAARGATLDVPEDADHETLMAALYTKSQGEIPGGGDPRPWPGCDGVPKKAAPRFGGAKKQEPAAAAKKPEDMLDQMATMLFKTRDADKDGKLSAEEMKTILDQTNAKAKAAGEPEIDFFKAADKDGDGYLDYEETQKFFSSQMGGAGMSSGAGGRKPAKAAAPAAGASAGAMDPEQMPELMFKNLDKNGDGSLSRAEMQNIIDQTNKQSANQQSGESGDDFFASLDKSGDGSIDKEEATAFFKSVAAMMAGGGNKDEV